MKSSLLTLSLLLVCALAFSQEVDSTAAEVIVAEEIEKQTQYYTDSAYSDEYEAESDYNNVAPQATQSAKAYMDEDVSVKKFEDSKWKDIVGNADFEEKPPKREPKKQDKKKKSSSGFSMPGISPEVLKMISFVVVFILFGFILYYVSRNTTLSQSVRKLTPADVSAPVENIEELDTEGLLKQALATGDLRLAVRIHYLLLLKKLNEAGLIAWKKDKTNRDYLSELYGRNACYDDVRSLTLAYEIVWYGERTVSSESFERLSGNFESVNRQITQVQPSV